MRVWKRRQHDWWCYACACACTVREVCAVHFVGHHFRFFLFSLALQKQTKSVLGRPRMLLFLALTVHVPVQKRRSDEGGPQEPPADLAHALEGLTLTPPEPPSDPDPQGEEQRSLAVLACVIRACNKTSVMSCATARGVTFKQSSNPSSGRRGTKMADLILPLASQGDFTFKRPLSSTVLTRHT